MLQYKKLIKDTKHHAQGVKSMMVRTLRGDSVEPPPAPASDTFMITIDVKQGYYDYVYLYYELKTENEPWSIVDVTSGEVVADSNGVTMNGVSLDVNGRNPAAGSMDIERETPGLRKYEISGGFKYIGIEFYDYRDNTDDVAEVCADVTVHNWSSNIDQYYFWFEQTNLIVPSTLAEHITLCGSMFAGCNLFNQNISTWNTSNVTDMNDMFDDARMFNQPIGNWDVSNVTDMEYMFQNAESFNQPLGGWNVTNVNSMSQMFDGATSFNQDISMWSVDNVVDMDNMFEQASSFNQDLSPWCVINIPNEPTDFDNGADLWVKPRPNWGTCDIPLEPDPDPEPEIPEPEPEVIVDDKDLQDFDYALIRYRWEQVGGRDLDTRTYMKVPDRVSEMVGWAMNSRDNDYLIWNNDNTGLGVESILVNSRNIVRDFPGQELISIDMRAFWYNTKRTGDLRIEFVSFKGGTMVPSGYDWANEGGTVVQKLTIDTHTPIWRSSAKERGQHLATLEIDTATNIGKLTKITEFTGNATGGNLGDGPSIDGPGSSGPVDGSLNPGDTSGGVDGDYGDYDDIGNGTGTMPTIPSASDGLEFRIITRDFDSSVTVDMSSPTGDWVLFENGTPVAGNNYQTDHATIRITDYSATVTLNNLSNTDNLYKLVATASNVRISETSNSVGYPGLRDFEIIKYTESLPRYVFTAYSGKLTVPDELPSYITSLDNMFDGCYTFNQDISNWDTSNVISMSGTFRSCLEFNQPIGDWNVSNVRYMGSMFSNTHEFNQNLNNWNTRNVEGMSYMFSSTVKFNQPLDNWNVSSVTSMYNMFQNSEAFNQPIDTWNVSNVTSMTYMFDAALAFNQNLRSWNTANVTDMRNMFSETQAFNGDITTWDVSGVTDMSYMFNMAESFNQDISYWNVSNVTNMYKMFARSKSFDQDLSYWCVPNVYDRDYFYEYAYQWSLPRPIWGTCPFGDNTDTPIDRPVIPQGLSFRVWSSTNNTNTITVNISDVEGDWTLYSGRKIVYDQTTSNNSMVTQDLTNKTLKFTFESGLQAKAYNLVVNSKKIVFSTSQYDYGESVRGELNVFSFGDHVTDIRFNVPSTRLTVPDTLPSNISTLRNMFAGCVYFNSDISNWDVSNITDMRGAFDGCMNFNQDLSAWDVTNVVDMVNMFAGCQNFNSDLSGWCVSNIKRQPLGFDSLTTKWTLPKPIWGTCAGVGEVEPIVIGGETNEYALKITNKDTLLTTPLEVIAQVYQPSSTWSVKNLDTDAIIASNSAPTSVDPRVVVTKNSDFLTVRMLSPVADTRRYAIVVSATSVMTRCQPTTGSDVKAHGVLEIISFSNQIPKYSYNVYNVDLIMPNYLPTNIRSLDSMFSNSPYFDQDLSTWDTSNVTSMRSVFQDCKKFDGDVSTWDVTNVTDMRDMFYNCYRFDNNLSGWDVSNVTNMNNMFYNCTYFNGDLSTWRPESVTDFGGMFIRCKTFNQDLSKWTVSSAITMSNMFAEASSFSQDLGLWDVSSAVYMGRMFYNTRMQTQDLSTWCVTNVRDKTSFLTYQAEYRHNAPVWGTCPLPGFGFIVTSDDTVESEQPFTVSMENVSPGWTLTANGEIIASEFDVATNVTVTGTNTVNISINGLRNTTVTYVLRGVADCAIIGGAEYEQQSGNRTIDVKNFFNGLRSYKFKIGSDSLTVPATIPVVVKSIKDMFAGCTSFNQDLSSWFTTNITDMSGAFRGCTSFNKNVNAWDVTNVTDMSDMFNGCISFDKSMNAWTTSNCLNMKNMFKDCEMFNQPLSTWVTDLVEDMSGIFYGCTSFNQNINTWDTSNVTDMSYAFYNCLAFNQPLDNWSTTSCTTLEHMFDGAVVFNQDISSWDVISVSNFDYMFNGCTAYNKNLDKWCVTLVTSTPTGFATGANSWTRLKPVWGTCPLTGLIITTQSNTNEYELAFSLNMSNDIKNWRLHDLLTGELVADQSGVYVEDATGINVYTNQITINRPGRSYAKYMLDGKMTSITVDTLGRSNDAGESITVDQFSYRIDNMYLRTGWVNLVMPDSLPPHITSLKEMFRATYAFNQDLSGWDTSNVTDMSEMFSYSKYNQPLNMWNTSNVTDMSEMFRQNDVFNQDLNNWDTSSVTNMSLMFYENPSFNGDVSTWNTSSVTNMSNMFGSCVSFNSDISGWDVSNVTTMYNMLATCVSFNQNIGLWNVKSVYDFTWMLYNTQVFNQDLSGWCVATINVEPDYFSSTTPAWTLPKPVWGTCPRLELRPPKSDTPTPPPPETPATPTVIDSATYKFSTQNFVNPDQRLIIRINTTDGLGDYTVKENGIVIAEWSSGIRGEGVSVDSYSIYIEGIGTGGYNEYELRFQAGNGIGIIYDGNTTSDLEVKAEVIVNAFSNTASGFSYRLKDTHLVVPEGLPSNVTDMNDMFDGCNLFNQNINAWDTSNVTSMYSTFGRCTNYNQPLSNWNLSKVTSIAYMFTYCKSFNQNLNDWDVSNVTNMTYAFSRCDKYDGPMDRWNVEKVNSMNSMFLEASVFNQDISMWNTPILEDVSSMFFRAYYFNQDLSLWCVPEITNTYYYSSFSRQAISWTLPKPVWGTCPTRPIS